MPDRLYRYQQNQNQADTSDDWWEILNTGDPEDLDSVECVIALAETETMAKNIANIPEYLETIKLLRAAIKYAEKLIDAGKVRAAKLYLKAIREITKE